MAARLAIGASVAQMRTPDPASTRRSRSFRSCSMHSGLCCDTIQPPAAPQDQAYARTSAPGCGSDCARRHSHERARNASHSRLRRGELADQDAERRATHAREAASQVDHGRSDQPSADATPDTDQAQHGLRAPRLARTRSDRRVQARGGPGHPLRALRPRRLHDRRDAGALLPGSSTRSTGDHPRAPLLRVTMRRRNQLVAPGRRRSPYQWRRVLGLPALPARARATTPSYIR